MFICRRFLFLLPLVLLNFDVFAQNDLVSGVLNQYIREMERTSEKSTDQKYWYTGINGGETILTSKFQYSSTDDSRLTTPKWASLERGPFLRIFIGKRYYDHSFEISIENLQQNIGYYFYDISESFGVSYVTTDPYTYFSGNYFYKLFGKKKLYISPGIHIGFGVSETNKGTSISSGGGLVNINTNEILLGFESNLNVTRKDRVVFNLGPQVRLGFKVGKRIDIFTDAKLMMTPYKVRTSDLIYQYNDEPDRTATIRTSVRNFNWGLGFAYNFVKRAKKKMSELDKLKENEKKSKQWF